MADSEAARATQPAALGAALKGLPPKLALLLALQEKARRADRRRLQAYAPYAKQAEFHAAGARHRERLLRAGNQLGKTMAGAAEAAMHLTGRYPGWWRGRRWDRPVIGWAAGVTGESTRDNVQRMLMGRPGQEGTGMIPGDDIVEWSTARSAAELMDMVRVRHVSGGTSILAFKFYEKGRQKWQGETLDFVWFDEEPPEAVYSEGLTRTNASGGLVWMTFTPLLGMSNVVRRFLLAPTPQRHDTNMTIEDALHIPEGERAAILNAYPPHEREARARGVPILGSGRIYPVAEAAIACEAFAIPPHWAQLGGLDFGWDHPFAAVRLAWDRDGDTVYVTDAFRQREATPVIHAAALRPWGAWLPWAWPHDGLQHSRDSGEPLAAQYRRQGLGLLPERAAFADGGNGVEAGLMEILDRMQTRRFKVFAHLADWFEEFRLYHRQEGRVVKEGDDLMDATRYAVMCLRFAVPPPGRRRRGALTMPTGGIV